MLSTTSIGDEQQSNEFMLVQHDAAHIMAVAGLPVALLRTPTQLRACSSLVLSRTYRPGSRLETCSRRSGRHFPSCKVLLHGSRALFLGFPLWSSYHRVPVSASSRLSELSSQRVTEGIGEQTMQRYPSQVS